MNSAELSLQSPRGFKRFYAAGGVRPQAEFDVSGLGIRERMPACWLDRPKGTGDYLLMLFHDQARAGTSAANPVPVRPDTLMIWGPGQGQHYGNEQAGFEHSWMHCSGPRMEAIFSGIALPLGSPLPVTNVAQILQCLLEIHGEIAAEAEPDYRVAGNLLENCLRAVARAHGVRKKVGRVSEPLLAARRLLDSVPRERVNFSELAREVGMSGATFSLAFKRHFGLSPKVYLVQCQMRRAAYLLSYRNLTVTQAAAEVGYEDPFHFSKLFKKHLGSSPSSLRPRA